MFSRLTLVCVCGCCLVLLFFLLSLGFCLAVKVLQVKRKERDSIRRFVIDKSTTNKRQRNCTSDDRYLVLYILDDQINIYFPFVLGCCTA